MPVAEATFASAQKLYLLAVFGYLADEGTGFGIKYSSAYRHLYYAVFTILAE